MKDVCLEYLLLCLMILRLEEQLIIMTSYPLNYYDWLILQNKKSGWFVTHNVGEGCVLCHRVGGGVSVDLMVIYYMTSHYCQILTFTLQTSMETISLLL